MNIKWWVGSLLVVIALALAGFALGIPAFRQPPQNPAGHYEGDGHDHGGTAAEHRDPAKHDEDGGDHAKDAKGHAAESEHDHAGEPPGAHADDDGHDHAHEASASKQSDHKHVEAEAVKLSEAAQANVGLQFGKVELRPFERTITVPGIVVERPGQTNVQVAATLTGVITKVWPMQGEAVTPGQPLFDLRLTHEEVVEAQAEFLQTAEELEVVQREIDRLEKVTASGAVPGKTLLDRKYEQQKLQAAQRSQRQRLLLHGLSPEQVDNILATRTLLSEITIAAPARPAASKKAADPVLLVQELRVEKGQHVKAGDPLCVLADHSELFIQGKAFEQDTPALDKTVANNWRITAMVDSAGSSRQNVSNLSLLYAASKIEPDSRALLFYVQLPNKLVRDRTTPEGHRFAAYQFKPGQRVELLVPIEHWEDRIVLPVTAVVQDGPESYVFEQNGNHFDRRAVHVEYRDQYSVVIANDGTVKPGATVIVAGAYQVHLAMKNKAGGAPDPHAGHNH